MPDEVPRGDQLLEVAFAFDGRRHGVGMEERREGLLHTRLERPRVDAAQVDADFVERRPPPERPPRQFERLAGGRSGRRPRDVDARSKPRANLAEDVSRQDGEDRREGRRDVPPGRSNRLMAEGKREEPDGDGAPEAAEDEGRANPRGEEPPEKRMSRRAGRPLGVGLVVHAADSSRTSPPPQNVAWQATFFPGRCGSLFPVPRDYPAKHLKTPRPQEGEHQ